MEQECNFLGQSTEAYIDGYRYGCNVFNQLIPADACMETKEAMRKHLTIACEEQANELESIVWIEYGCIGLLLLIICLLIKK